MSLARIIFRVSLFTLVYIFAGLGFLIPLAQISAPLLLIGVVACLWFMGLVTMIPYQITRSKLDYSVMTDKIRKKQLRLNLVSTLSLVLAIVTSSTFMSFWGHLPIVLLLFQWIPWIFVVILLFKFPDCEPNWENRYQGLKFLIAWVLIVAIVMSVSYFLKINIFQWRL